MRVCRPSIESPRARPSYGSACPFPWAAARSRTAPPGWHFVPNGMEGCVDKYGCARPSFDSDFWKWVSTGEEGCADEHGCARPRLPGKGDATPPRQAVEKPEGPGKKGEKPEELNREATPGPNRAAALFQRNMNCRQSRRGRGARRTPRNRDRQRRPRIVVNPRSQKGGCIIA
jgi:hypothetical protein